MIFAILSLIASIGCYSCSQLAQHGKLKWMSKNPLGFWGEDSDERKYDFGISGFKILAPNTLSATLLVWTTDGYHACPSVNVFVP